MIFERVFCLVFRVLRTTGAQISNSVNKVAGSAVLLYVRLSKCPLQCKLIVVQIFLMLLRNIIYVTAMDRIDLFFKILHPNLLHRPFLQKYFVLIFYKSFFYEDCPFSTCDYQFKYIFPNMKISIKESLCKKIKLIVICTRLYEAFKKKSTKKRTNFLQMNVTGINLFILFVLNVFLQQSE